MLRVVLECAAKLFDAGGERRIAHRDVTPDGSNEIVLGDDMPGMAGEDVKDGERLGRDMELACASRETFDRVQTKRPKSNFHKSPRIIPRHGRPAARILPDLEAE